MARDGGDRYEDMYEEMNGDRGDMMGFEPVDGLDEDESVTDEESEKKAKKKKKKKTKNPAAKKQAAKTKSTSPGQSIGMEDYTDEQMSGLAGRMNGK